MLVRMEGLIAAFRQRRPRGSSRAAFAKEPPAGRASNDEARASADFGTARCMTWPEAGATDQMLPRGTRVSRYVVQRPLGSGGMGVIYEAYDPELGRKVALKLMRPGIASSNGRVRLVREAQALAKLSHPNIVTLHDAGTVRGTVWLAMELVEGQTLRQWLGSTPRRWREVVRVMRRAGEGLAAAHAADLLHRDFKPDNVMVDDDGRVRVMDFGLARIRHDSAPHPLVGSEAPDNDMFAIEITARGTLVGTVRYMAPEQLQHGPVTQAADQYAFCVTLWEALYGQRPGYAGTSPMRLRHPRRGRLARGRSVPGWLRRACVRGLAYEPTDRWPSMRALLDTLAKGRARARMRKLLVLAAVAVLLAIVAGGYRWRTGPSRVGVADATQRAALARPDELRPSAR